MVLGCYVTPCYVRCYHSISACFYSTISLVDPRKQHNDSLQVEGTHHVKLITSFGNNDGEGTPDSGHQVMSHSQPPRLDLP